VFFKEEYLLHNYTMCLGYANRQKSRLKVYADEKPTFLKGVWHLIGTKCNKTKTNF